MDSETHNYDTALIIALHTSYLHLPQSNTKAEQAQMIKNLINKDGDLYLAITDDSVYQCWLALFTFSLLTPSLTHSLIHSLIHSLTHSLTHTEQLQSQLYWWSHQDWEC